MAEVKQRIASAVRAARKELGLSQQQVADKIGTTLETVSKCERGVSSPTVEVFLAMVRELHLPVDDLLGQKDERGQVSVSRARVEAEIAVASRLLSEADLRLLSDFINLLRKRQG